MAISKRPAKPTKRRHMRATTEISESLPPLLEERGLSVNALADEIGVRQSHLSRAIRGADGRKVSGELAAQIAVALALPEDYFRETRAARLIEEFKRDPDLLDRLYDATSLARFKRF